MIKGQSVKPLKKGDVEKIFKLLEEEENIIMLGIVKFALNTGLRISDILLLKFENIENSFIIEKKTKKSKNIIYNSSCKKITKRLAEFYKKRYFYNYNTGYLFKSSVNPNKPISYQGVNYHIKALRIKLKIDYPMNTHSFRKTWARTVYYKYNDLVLVMKLLNHSNPKVTLRYIGIEEEEIKKVYSEVLF